MRIVGYFHLFPPEHNAGSETTVHAALRAMVRRGHSVQVICDRSVTAPYTIDGIEVLRPPRRGQQRWLEDFVKDCDLTVTHLDLTSQAMGLATNTHKPLVHFVHNSAQLQYWNVKEKAYGGGGWAASCQLVVFNSNWIQQLQQWPGAQVTVHPVVEAEYYRCERGEKVTLVNPTPGKGVETFKALAVLMPEQDFLAVEGGYGQQMISASSGNIEWMAHTPDIREVFRKTKVLLMPSDYESYGRVGIEAACAGIPTVAHPTEGLKEAFGEAGIFIDRNDVPLWHIEVKRLLTDEVYYRTRSDAVLALAATLNPEPEFDRLEAALLVTSETWKDRNMDISAKVWTADRRIYRKADGTLTDDRSQALSLHCAEGQPMKLDDAVQAGFVQLPAVRIVGEEHTDDLTGGVITEERIAAERELAEKKMVAGPKENKAEKPRANKAA